MFRIISAYRFFDKVRSDYVQVEADIADANAALNCILSLYHLHEWVWAKWLKPRRGTQPTLASWKRKRDFKTWLDTNCPYFGLLQKLANGTKHCKPVHSTETVAGYGKGPWGVGPYGKAYLLIDLGEEREPEERYLVASDVLRSIMSFWTDFFATHQIVDDADSSPSE